VADPGWIFDSVPESGAITGGLPQGQTFSPHVDTFIREVLQNCRDQKTADSEPVRVRLRLEEISGAVLEDFLRHLEWGSLSEHLAAAGAERDYVTIAGHLRTSLRELDDSGRLRLLRIDDFGTRGLVGGEDEDRANFNMLCRHTLVTSGSRQESGGSYGLGKSVLWEFSGFSTVLFGSGVSDGEIRPRFFGSVLLPTHRAEGRRWRGPGWFGAPGASPEGGRRSESIWDAEAEAVAKACRLDRPAGESGTSILVVGFDDPAAEVEPGVEEMCGLFADSAARWFWPTLGRGEMSVMVEGFVDSEQVYGQHARETAEIRPFALAQNHERPGGTALEEPGDVADREIPLRIPAHKEDVMDPMPATEARALLRVRLAESGDSEERINTVALQRGTGMVVRYETVGQAPPSGQTFHAVLLAGSAHGDSVSDRAAERFLRAAEPVAHERWTHETERIADEYRRGAGKALTDFRRAIADAIREFLQEEAAESTDAPEDFLKLFPLPGIQDEPSARKPYRLSNTEGVLDGQAWRFRGTFAKGKAARHDWRFRVSLVIDQEGAGSEHVPIASLDAPDAASVSDENNGDWTVDVPAGRQEIAFTGITESLDEVPDLQRVRVTLEVRSDNR